MGLRSGADGRDINPGLGPVRQLRRRLPLATGPRIAACQLLVRPQDAYAQTRGDRRTDATHQRTIVAWAFRPVEPAGRSDVSPRLVPGGGRWRERRAMLRRSQGRARRL